MPTMEEYVAKHEAQIDSSLKGKKHLEGLDADAKLAADRYHIDKTMANTNYLHGDGLFPLRDSNRQLINLNGKVTSGGTLDMTVEINDYLALIDGYILGNKVLDPNKTTKVLIASADLTNPRIDIVCLKPALDLAGKRQHAHGDCYAIAGFPASEPVAPEVPDGSILLAEVRVNPNATGISDDDITDKRDYLLDMDDLNKNLLQRIEEAKEEAKREVLTIVLAELEAVRDEIAAGDETIKTELQEKIDLVKADIADLNVSVQQIWTDLNTLRSYVDEKVTLLTSVTDALNDAVVNLQSADEETEAFKQTVSDKISEIEGDIVGIQESIQNNLQRIEVVEQKIESGAGLGNLTALVNIAKTNFKVDSYHNAYANNMFKGWVDVFSSIDDIDPDLSSDWEHVAYLKYIQPSSGIEPSVKGLWLFEEGQGNVAVDYSGNGNHGIIPASIIYDVGHDGYGLKVIAKTGSGVNCGNADSIKKLSEAVSFEFWIKAPSPNSGYIYPIQKTDTYDIAFSYRGAVADGPYWMAMRIWWTAGGKSDYIYKSISIDDWTHFVYAFDYANTKRLKVYRNGVKIGDAPVQMPLIISNYVLRLLYNATVGYNLDGIAVYSRALSEAEALAHATAYPWQTVDQAIVVTKAHTASSAPSQVLLVAEGDVEVTFQVSREDGTTWTDAANKALTDISAQPAGTAMRVKATIPAGKKLDDIALFWA